MSDPSFCFDYELPRELVAQEPLRNRIDARLMIVDRGRQTIEHYHIRDLPELLKASDRLVLNDTKVIPAQLAGKRIPTGGRWQGLYLETTADGHWKLLCKSRGRMKPGDAIALVDVEGRPGVKLWMIEPLEEGPVAGPSGVRRTGGSTARAVGPRAAAAVHSRRTDGRRRRDELSDGVRARARCRRRADRGSAFQQGAVEDAWRSGA